MQDKILKADIGGIRTLPVILAGLAGGAVEIAWVSLYSSVAGTGAGEVARQVTATALPFTAGSEWAPALGIGIHMVLSIVLAAAFAATLFGPIARRFGATGIFLGGLATLSAVWAVNFFLLLPLLNPGFPLLMPYAVTFISKLLFGAAMSGVLISRRGLLPSG
jgi:hypothetical protein